MTKEAQLKTAKEQVESDAKTVKDLFDEMKKQLAGNLKDVKSLAKDLTDLIKSSPDAITPDYVQKILDSIALATATIKPKDNGTKIDDKTKPAKLLMESPEVLTNEAGTEDAPATSSLQELLASVFDGLFAQ